MSKPIPIPALSTEILTLSSDSIEYAHESAWTIPALLEGAIAIGHLQKPTELLLWMAMDYVVSIVDRTKADSKKLAELISSLEGK